MSIVQALIERNEARAKEMASCYEQLAVWAAVKEQGINIDTVDSFGFDQKLLTSAQMFEYQRAAVRRQPDPVTGRRGIYDRKRPYLGERLPSGHYKCVVYNYVRLKDGTRTILNPMLKAPR